MKRRLFISLNIPEDIKEAIGREIEKIRHQFTDNIRFMDKEQWHVTVTFLGPQEDEIISRILKAIKETAGNFDAPEIEFSDIGYGPKNGNPRTQRSEQSSHDGNPRTQRSEQSSHDGNPRTQRAEQSSHDGTPRMIWLNGSVKSSKLIQNLKDTLEDNLIDNGVVFGREHRQFNIHITLARFLSAENLPELNIEFKREFSAPTLDLMESHASRGGAKYEFLQKMHFRLE